MCPTMRAQTLFWTVTLNNLGLGAMSNSFDIHGAANPAPPTKLSRQALIDTYWWAGDNLARSPGFNYDGLNVPNKDEQTNPTHGSCTTVGDIGSAAGLPPSPLRPEHALHRAS